MWPRMLVLSLLVALLVGGSPTAGAAHGRTVRGHSDLPHTLVTRGHADVPRGVTGGAASAPAARGSWSWPVPPPHGIARPYLAPPTAYAAGHRGVDLRAAEGAAVTAPDDGVVHFVGVVVDRPVLSLEHADGVLSSFEPVASTLTAGEGVARGEVIGTLLPGHCDTPCLHLGARVDGGYVNPLLFLGGVPWSVLLPSG